MIIRFDLSTLAGDFYQLLIPNVNINSRKTRICYV